MHAVAPVPRCTKTCPCCPAHPRPCPCGGEVQPLPAAPPPPHPAIKSVCAVHPARIPGVAQGGGSGPVPRKLHPMLHTPFPTRRYGAPPDSFREKVVHLDTPLNPPPPPKRRFNRGLGLHNPEHGAQVLRNRHPPGSHLPLGCLTQQPAPIC